MKRSENISQVGYLRLHRTIGPKYNCKHVYKTTHQTHQFLTQMTLLIDNMTNTQWLQTIATSNTEVYQQIADMVNIEGYPLDDIRDFVEDYGLNAFTEGHYHTWEKLEETYSREVIETWVDIAGIDAIGNLEDYYMGAFQNEEDFAEHYFTETIGCSELDVLIEAGIVIDWESTWYRNLSYDFTFENGYVFNRN